MTKEIRHAKQEQKTSADHGRSGSQSGVREEGRDTVEGGEGVQPGGRGNGHPPGTALTGAEEGDREKVVHPSYLTFTEDSARRALIEARGDIFIASQILGVTAIRLDRAVGVSLLLQTTMDESQGASSSSVSDDQIQAAVTRRMALYRVAGLDALHDLATMQIDSNSAQNQVKLAAAARLAGPTEGSSAGDGLAEVLRELNTSYEANAPRLRVIRERVTVETLPAERVVVEQGKDG